MNCPVCKEPMIVLELNEVEIDNCFSCGGIWLDAGELEILLEGSNKSEAIIYSMKRDTKSKEKALRCPVCNKKMDKISAGIDKVITLDKCRNKHGFWFDGGELEEILFMAKFDEDNKILDLLKEIFKHKIKKGVKRW